MLCPLRARTSCAPRPHAPLHVHTPPHPYNPTCVQVYDAIHYYNIAREAADSEFSYQFEILRFVNLLRAQAPPFALSLSMNPTPFYPAPAAPAAAAAAAADIDTEEESATEEESESEASVNSLLAE